VNFALLAFVTARSAASAASSGSLAAGILIGLVESLGGC